MSVPDLLPCGHPRDCAEFVPDSTGTACRGTGGDSWTVYSLPERRSLGWCAWCAEMAALRAERDALQARVDAARAAVAGAQFSSVRQVNRLGEAVEKALEGK